METDKYTVQDLIKHSYQQQPIEFENVFNDLITDRIAAAVNDRKIELSQSMLADPQDSEEDEETESEEE